MATPARSKSSFMLLTSHAIQSSKGGQDTRMSTEARAAAITRAAQELATAISLAPEPKAPANGSGTNVISVEQGFKDRDYFSNQLSKICRQLGFAGLAIVWLFKTGEPSAQVIPLTLVLPSFLLVLALSFDLLHYFSGNLVLEYFTHQAQKNQQDNFVAPFWMNYPNRFFFYGKTLLIAISYLYLLGFLGLTLILRNPLIRLLNRP